LCVPYFYSGHTPISLQGYPRGDIPRGIVLMGGPRLTLWRREFIRYRRRRGWTLVYGRRKTGKTFMVRLYEKGALYVTITRSATSLVEEPGQPLQHASLEEAVGEIVKRLRGGSTVMVDEFQRLPAWAWDSISMASPEGRLVLVASSLGVVEKVFDRNSPLLGLVAPFRVDPLRYADALASLAARTGPGRAVEWAVLLTEPWLAPHAEASLDGDPARFLAENASSLADMAKGLVGEVFQEEERALTRLYDSILHLLGAGVWRASELSSLLYARGLLSKPVPATGILEKMARIGLVEKTPLWRTRGHRVYYRHKSHLLAIIYGLRHYLGIDEITLPTGVVEKYARMLLARELQFAVGSLLAELHDGVPALTIPSEGEGDVDVVILDARRKRPIAAYEALSRACTGRDARQARERASRVGAPLAGLVCLGGPPRRVPHGLEVLGPEDLVRAAREVVVRLAREPRHEEADRGGEHYVL